MSLNVDSYLTWRYHRQHSNCWHLLRAAWLDLTGEDLGDRTPEVATQQALIARVDSEAPKFARLDRPEEPCIVLMRSPGAVPHVGVFVRRRVLQASARGASFLPLAAARQGFHSVEFYR